MCNLVVTGNDFSLPLLTVSVNSLGYIVGPNGNLVEIDFNKSHVDCFNEFILENNLSFKPILTKAEGFDILTKNGYVVYYGPFDRNEMICRDTSNNYVYSGMDLKYGVKKYMCNPLLPKREYLRAACFLPDTISDCQKDFLKKLIDSNKDENNEEICIVDFGYYSTGTICKDEFINLLKCFPVRQKIN